MAIERGLESDRCIEVLTELTAKLLQLIQAQIAKLRTLLQGETNCIADLFVRRAEGNSLVHEIGGTGHRIQKAGLRGLAHASEVEFERGCEARQQRQHGRLKLDLKC